MFYFWQHLCWLIGRWNVLLSVQQICPYLIKVSWWSLTGVRHSDASVADSCELGMQLYDTELSADWLQFWGRTVSVQGNQEVIWALRLNRAFFLSLWTLYIWEIWTLKNNNVPPVLCFTSESVLQCLWAGHWTHNWTLTSVFVLCL